jgi:hypothetical protein
VDTTEGAIESADSTPDPTDDAETAGIDSSPDDRSVDDLDGRDHNTEERDAEDRDDVDRDGVDRDDEFGPAPSLVRPYTLTAGRTTPEVYLPLEAPVHVVSNAAANPWPATDVRTRIVLLCADGPSVAEISARLDIPLGVARVLVGDLVGTGILRVSMTLGDDATADERRELIGRTLRGLRAL